MILRGPEIIGVYSADEYAEKQRAVAGAKGRAIRSSPFTLTAFVDEGRWMADCLCGNGIPLHRDWPAGRCVSCGLVYETIEWPANFDEIETTLAALPMRQRSWRKSTANVEEG